MNNKKNKKKQEKVFVKKASIKDIEYIFSNQYTFDRIWIEKIDESEKQNKYYTYYILIVDEKIAGYITFYTVIDTIEIMRIAIKSKYRKKGYGKILLKKSLDIEKQYVSEKSKNLENEQINEVKIMLEVNEDNIAAINMYKSLEFKVINKRKKYYKDKTALILCKTERV